MTPNLHSCDSQGRQRCCGCSGHDIAELSRRGFLEGAVLGGTALTGLTWPLLGAAQDEVPAPPPRRPVVVKPVLIYSVPTRATQTSWRNWGGIQTEADADGECARINTELKQIQTQADFPVSVLPLSPVKTVKAIEAIPDLASADAVLLYAAGGDIYGIEKLGKPVIVFLRHRSGPVSLWYEIVSPRLLRRTPMISRSRRSTTETWLWTAWTR